MTYMYYKNVQNFISAHRPAPLFFAFFCSLFFISTYPHICIADGYVKYRGLLGVSGDIGLTRLQPRDLNSPEYVRGLTGGLRVFYGITNTIGVEAMFHGSNLIDYSPTIVVQPETDDELAEAEIVALPEVTHPQQQQYALGVFYILDSFRLMPSFGLGIARVRTGALSLNYGQTVADNHLYFSGMVDYKFTPWLWAGVNARINLQLSDNAGYERSANFLFRISLVWQLRKLVTGIIAR